MHKRTFLVCSMFAIGVVFSSVTESADHFEDDSSDELEVRVSAGPSEVNGSVGETVRLDCTSEPPNNYELRWARVDNAPLPQTAKELDGALIIRDADSDASGVYVCNAVSELTNDIISNASVTVNIVESNGTFQVPTLNIDPERQTVLEGGLAVIRCTSPTHPNATIEWRRAHNQFTTHVQISNNEIRIPSAAVEDRGVYICEYANAVGAARASSRLEIDRRKAPVIEIYPMHRQKIEINGSAFIECRVRKGVPPPKIRWLRGGQRVSSSHVVEDDGVLRFTGVTNEDAGEYTCSAENAAGSVDAIAGLEIISRPDVTPSTVASISPKEKNVVPLHQMTADVNNEITYTSEYAKRHTFGGGGDNHTVANVTKKSVEYGHNVDLVCDTDLDPPVNYSWIIHSYEKSWRKIVPNTRALTVVDASVNDSGIYFCKAVSSRATLRLATILTVEYEGVIPAFAGSSYVTLPSIVKNSAFVDRNDIEIHFRPKSDSGLILFNTLRNYRALEYKDDFISFGLNGGFPEFRFEVGSTSGAIIRSDAPLQMDNWHKVILSRNGRDGFMQINGIANFTGSSTDRYRGPNLVNPLFVGGHSNYTYTNERTKLSGGFKGCIRGLRINSEEIDLKKEALSKENVGSCGTCDPNPCLNDGFCQQTTPSLDHYYCICRPGYGGENCQLRKDTCYADSCGTGLCLENEDGIECYCPSGTTGKRCEKRTDINV